MTCEHKCYYMLLQTEKNENKQWNPHHHLHENVAVIFCTQHRKILQYLHRRIWTCPVGLHLLSHSSPFVLTKTEDLLDDRLLKRVVC